MLIEATKVSYIWRCNQLILTQLSVVAKLVSLIVYTVRISKEKKNNYFKPVDFNIIAVGQSAVVSHDQLDTE